MESVFTGILSTSIAAGFMVLAIVLVRIFFRKMPKNFRCLLWTLVGVRLLFPFSIESAFGVVPRVEIEQGSALSGQFYPGMLSEDMQPGQMENFGTKEQTQTENLNGDKEIRAEKFMEGDKKVLLLKAGALCWILGVFFWLGYFFLTWCRIRDQLKTAVPEENMGTKIYRSERIVTPFLFGIIHPRIYIPMHIDGENLPYIIRHECAHKKRKDYLIKPAAFMLLCIHWFNPCVWLAYKLMCRDIELACDELVIRKFTVQEKKAYSTALLSCSISQRKIVACQAFFGESGIKERVKNVFSYKKPAFLAVVLSVLVCLLVSLCFMTTRKEGAKSGTGLSMSQANGEAKISDSQPKGADMEENQETEGQANGADATGGFHESGSKNSVQEDRTNAGLQERTEFVKQWVRAFCNRDGEKIYDMYSEEYKQNATESEMMPTAENEYSFGWSSPWPVDGNLASIVELTEDHAEILYYAWVSDPHVSVWRQSLSYHMEDDKWLIDQVDTEMMEYICVLEEYEKAYPEGQINDTPMDYMKNGMGETLNNNALLSSTTIYQPLFKPDTAAVYLLNLLQNEGKVEVKADVDENGGKAKVTVEFKEDGNRVEVLMVQPYGENGIWVPQTYEG